MCHAAQKNYVTNVSTIPTHQDASRHVETLALPRKVRGGPGNVSMGAINGIDVPNSHWLMKKEGFEGLPL
jgi:hypothetical protein